MHFGTRVFVDNIYGSDNLDDMRMGQAGTIMNDPGGDPNGFAYVIFDRDMGKDHQIMWMLYLSELKELGDD